MCNACWDEAAASSAARTRAHVSQRTDAALHRTCQAMPRPTAVRWLTVAAGRRRTSQASGGRRATGSVLGRGSAGAADGAAVSGGGDAARRKHRRELEELKRVCDFCWREHIHWRQRVTAARSAGASGPGQPAGPRVHSADGNIFAALRQLSKHFGQGHITWQTKERLRNLIVGGRCRDAMRQLESLRATPHPILSTAHALAWQMVQVGAEP